MSSQQHVPLRRANGDVGLLDGLATRLFDARGQGRAGADHVARGGPTRLERVEHRLRSTKLAWWLRRYGGVYRRMAALTDADVAKTLGMVWLVYVVASVVAAAAGGPGTAAIGIPFGIVLFAATIGAVAWWFTYRRSDQQLRHQMLAREGFARGREVAEHVGALKHLGTAATVRPTWTAAAQAEGRTVAPEDVAFLLGYSYGEEVWLGLERPVYVLGPARSGKGVNLVTPLILAAPGACITTSTRTDNLEATSACRAERGPVEVFNLEASGAAGGVTVQLGPVLVVATDDAHARPHRCAPRRGAW